MDPPTPLREPEEENPPQSPGALNSFRKGIVKTLQTAPQYIMAGAVVAAAAAGFLKVRFGLLQCCVLGACMHLQSVPVRSLPSPC